ncbi:pirin family protein [Neptunicella sp. SCSIO 80796]|uniref:pirin family protein n=1 Tax=Neptunicella plasticusilytica TaxID=3117012 RepID=UPI003A4D9ADB
MNQINVQEQIVARPASDGDGVKLLRVFGGPQLQRFDPFLMLDEFGSEQAEDYIGGFPPHPHRGFETVTYMLQGKMEHRDHIGNVGLLEDGGVQWMTAGKGIIHSEMPKQTEGMMRGFQLWVNLPANRKMIPASYQDIAAGDIAVHQLAEGTVKVIAGRTRVNDTELNGYFSIADTEVSYLDISIEAGQSMHITVPTQHNAMIYSYQGQIQIGDNRVNSKAKTLSRLSGQGKVVVENPTDSVARLLFLSGKPLQQPIAQYGPFVMNTHEEIEQAIQDYQAGVLTD